MSSQVYSRDQPPSEIVYYPMVPIEGAPLWTPPTHMTVVIRTRHADPLSLAPAARRIVTALDREVPVANVQTLRTIVERSTARTTFAMLLLAVAGSMALVLSAVGIYGVISYAVAQRTREMGVRLALGARPGQLKRLVVAQMSPPVLTGLAIGLAVAVGLSRYVGSLLFETSPRDPVIYAIVCGVLVSAALASAYLPARRASRVDPMIALRSE